MAFIAKNSPFFNGQAVDLVDVTDNKSHSVAEAHDARGNIVAATEYAKVWAPRFSFRLNGTGVSNITLPLLGRGYDDGDVQSPGIAAFLPSYDIAAGGGVVVPESITINTAFGSETTIEIACRAFGYPLTSGSGCPWVYGAGLSIPAGVCAHAKILFDAFTLSGTGCHLNTANYNIAAKIEVSTGAGGEPVSWSAIEGRIEGAVTIAQSGAAKPVLTPGSGYRFLSPLTCANPQADYPTWTATLRKDLESADYTAA